MKLLFDATVLASGNHKNSKRSGIFVVARELLRELLAREDLELTLYAAPSAGQGVKRYVKNAFPEFRGRFIASERFHWLEWIREKTECLKERKNGPLGKLFVRAMGVAGKGLAYFADRYAASPVSGEELQKCGVFLSPAYLPPRFIRRSGLAQYTILYDTIPKLFPQFSIFSRLGLSWNFDLIRNLNEKDHGFAISECAKRDFLRFCPRLKPENVTVIPLAAEQRLFHPECDAARIAEVKRKYGIPEHPYVLSVCTIEPRKNLQFALQAFACFLEKHPESDLHFVLAGGRWARFERKWRKQLAQMGKLRDRIILPGYVDDEELAPLYGGAAFFIYPSLYEGFGLPPLEAMQCGCPVITSNTSSLPEVVGDAGIMVGPSDVARCTGAMEKILSEPEFREGMIRRGLERSRLFSWEKAAGVILDTIQGEIHE